ncbi:MAG: carboxypeptidase regulatory-like domain-containing protein [Longimicrobiales bacterium]|nr:carboxypeptidase regulatory-like domain-containing protein [Longimicrobiales bacterium]
MRRDRAPSLAPLLAPLGLPLVALTLALALALALAPAPVRAQLISGTVTDSVAGVPVAGALVRVLGVAGGQRTAFLTGPDGRYQVVVDSAGSYALAVERIGYRAVTEGPFAVSSPGVTRRDIRIAQTAIELGGLVVEQSHRTCTLTAEQGGGTQEVWDQVRTALSAASLTTRRRSLAFQIRERQRRLAPENLTVLDQTERTVPALGRNSVRSLPPEELEEEGFVRTTAAGDFEYLGPDAEVLLSDAFLRSHCFSLIQGGTPQVPLIGLRFEPAGAVARPDIEGVAWVDPGSARLERIEFSYVGLPFEVGTALAGGVVRYLELPTGSWVVRDWHIRAPVVQIRRTTTGRDARDRQVVTEVQETGAEVVSLRDGDFEWSPDLPTYTLAGVAWDSVRAAPLAGAVVRVAGRGWRAATDSLGRFQIPNLAPDRYRVVLEHPRLDSLGLQALQQDARVGPAAPPLAFAVPARLTLMALRCGGEARVVVGAVRMSGGGPPPGAARVVATAPDGLPLLETVSDGDGWWALCGPPAGEVRVRAELPFLASTPVPVTVPDSGVVQAELELPEVRAGADGARNPGEGWVGTLTVSGTIRDVETGRGIASAEVLLTGPDGEPVTAVLTDAEGRYSLTAPSREETLRLGARSLGYAALESAPLAVARRGYRVDLDLAPEAVALEGVVVSVEARNPRLDDVGFYQRQRTSIGRFVDRVDLQLDGYVKMSDALMRLGGVLRQVDMASVTLDTTRRYLTFRGARFGGNNGCLPAIYVDGAVVRFPRLIQDGGLDSSYPTLDEIVRAFDVEAVELYDGPSSGPAQYVQSQPPCGSIVVWTVR